MMKSHFKTKRYISRRHLEFVAEQQCCLSWKYNCKGGVQAHHLLKPWHGSRGMGMKADDKNAIPLCFKHHQLLHDVEGNEDQFWLKNYTNENYGRIVAQYMWFISPDYKEE